MPHSLIAGMTCTGKSSIAKLLLPRWAARGFGTAVLDPLRDPTWGNADFITTDPERFLLYCKSSRRKLALFVDEGAQTLARAVDYNWLTTQSRHWEHEAHILSQRPQDLTPPIRGNCEFLWLFQTDPNAADLLAREWNRPELKDAVRNPKLHFHFCRRLAELRTGRVDHDAKTIVLFPESQCKQNHSVPSSGSSSASRSRALASGAAKAKRKASSIPDRKSAA